MNISLKDLRGRCLKSLRLSVTDRCNFRCQYCMPESNYVWMPKKRILRFEEIERLVNIFGQLGVCKIRFTGGEPLLRTDLPKLVAQLARKTFFKDLALTTNGSLLDIYTRELKNAGLHRLTISLDTLLPHRFLQFTGVDQLSQVLKGIEHALGVGFKPLKLNMVVIRGFNEDEMISMLEFANEIRAELRFIEYMDVGGATQWSKEKVVSRLEMLEILRTHYGKIKFLNSSEHTPASTFILPNGTSFGIISSTTEPFCSHCDRSRLTADGIWYLCLYASKGINVKSLLRTGKTDQEILQLLSKTWKKRKDQGAKDRLQIPDRGPLYSILSLQKDPHLEMHTRGG